MYTWHWARYLGRKGSCVRSTYSQHVPEVDGSLRNWNVIRFSIALKMYLTAIKATSVEFTQACNSSTCKTNPSCVCGARYRCLHVECTLNVLALPGLSSKFSTWSSEMGAWCTLLRNTTNLKLFTSCIHFTLLQGCSIAYVFVHRNPTYAKLINWRRSLVAAWGSFEGSWDCRTLLRSAGPQLLYWDTNRGQFMSCDIWSL